MRKNRMSEIEQPQRQRRDGLHRTPLILQQRAHAARHNGTGRNGSSQLQLVPDVNARAADADAIMQQTIAENDLERRDAKHAQKFLARGLERDAATGCAGMAASLLINKQHDANGAACNDIPSKTAQLISPERSPASSSGRVDAVPK